MKNNHNFPKIKKELARILGKQNVLDDAVSLALNSYDCSTVRTKPDFVLNIRSTEVLPQVIKILNLHKIPFVPRMSATNHAGGCITLKGGCVLNLSALDKILEINTAEGYAIVEAGVINQTLQNELAPLGYFYAPDPASMQFTTIGGNAALNAGGMRGLKYGTTIANILKAEFILPDGETVFLDNTKSGPSTLPFMTHSEGTLGIITKLWVKVLPKPKEVKTILACFKNLNDTMLSVSEIIANGIVPCALEAMDKTTIEATATKLPQGAEAVLIIELDGDKTEQEKETVIKICKNNKALSTEYADNPKDRQILWMKRQNACSALSSMAPNVMALDGTVPRQALPQAIGEIKDILNNYNVRAGMVFHAGDGNTHPNIIFDERNLFEVNLIKKAVKEINAVAVKYGGTITGEHGIGVEKRASLGLMFDQKAINLFKEIKESFDPFNISNPDKVLPLSTKTQTEETETNKAILSVAEKIKYNFKLTLPTIIAGSQSKFKHKDALDISALNNIVEIDTQNYTVTTEGATPLKKLAQELKKHNVYLPIPDTEGTIGGAFAAKTFDCLLNYATGATLIMPNGDIINIGGKFIKNSAGYELLKLMCGSCGTYGIIARITLRIFAEKPKNTEPKKFAFFKPDALDKKFKKIFDFKNLLNSFVFEEGGNGR